jgi:hypothetical protein
VGSGAPVRGSAYHRFVRSFGRSWSTRSEVVCGRAERCLAVVVDAFREVVCGRVATLFLAVPWTREGRACGRLKDSLGVLVDTGKDRIRANVSGGVMDAVPLALEESFCLAFTVGRQPHRRSVAGVSYAPFGVMG